MAQYLPPETLRVGNGVETVFGFGFPYLTASDVFVTVNDVPTAYSLIGTAQVSINPAPAVGAQIRIYRSTPAQYPENLFDSGIPMLPKYIDENNDQLLYALQEGLMNFDAVVEEARDISARSLRVPDSELPIDPLPPAAVRASSLLGFDSAGRPALAGPVSGDASDLALQLAGPEGVALVGNAADKRVLASTSGTSQIGGPRGSLEADLLRIDSSIIDRTQTLEPTVRAQLSSQIGDLGAVSAAVARRVLNITVVGDSIAEGISQNVYQDSIFGIWVRTLQEQNPYLTVRVVNFAIPGQGLGNLADPNYKGVNFGDSGGFWMPSSGPVEDRWPGGSVLGKSWWDHIRDSTPDLLVFAFGMNHVSPALPLVDYNQNIQFDAIWYKALVGETASWPVAPSIALVTSMLPTTNPTLDGGVWPYFHGQVQDSANAARGVCAEMNWTCVDANRWWVLHTEAKDVGAMQYKRALALDTFPQDWTTVSGSYTVIAPDAIQGLGTIKFNEPAEDLYVRVSMTMGDDSQQGAIFYRDYGDIVGGQYNRYWAEVFKHSSGTWYMNLYWQGNGLASVPLPSMVGRTCLLEVHVEGAHHRVYVDGTRVADVWHYGNVKAGAVGLYFASGAVAGAFSSSILRVGTPAELGDAHYTEEDMLGLGQDEWASNPDSLGGGLRNHPSKLGVKLAYIPALAPLTGALRRLSESPADHVSAVTNNSTEDFFTGWTSSRIVIDDNPDTAVAHPQGADGADRALTVSAQRTVNGGRDVTVYAWWNGASQKVPTTITLPTGRWLVTATYTAARQHANNTQLQQLRVLAIKV